MLTLSKILAAGVALLAASASAAEPRPEVRFVGFRAPPAFLVGYGLDHAENYRHLPFIADLE